LSHREPQFFTTSTGVLPRRSLLFYYPIPVPVNSPSMVNANEPANLEEVEKEIRSIHSSTSTSMDHDYDMDVDADADVEKLGSDGESIRIETESTTSVRAPGTGNGKGKGVMGKVMSRISTRSSWKDPGPPPDGGWAAWTQGV